MVGWCSPDGRVAGVARPEETTRVSGRLLFQAKDELGIYSEWQPAWLQEAGEQAGGEGHTGPGGHFRDWGFLPKPSSALDWC